MSWYCFMNTQRGSPKAQKSEGFKKKKKETNKDDKKEANNVSTHRILYCTEPYTNMLKG